MAAVVEVLRKYWVVLLAFTWVLATLFALMAGDRNGYARGQTEGEILIAKLREEQADQRAQTAEQNLQQYRQQVAKANLAEEQLLIAQDELAKAKKQLSERIPHVTTVYRPARSAAPVPIPRPVFTCGWLRDFNTALGASVSVPAACTAAAGVAETAWPGPGSDAELLESGVSAADILAHAQDYGAWAQNNVVQLRQLLDLNSKEAQP